MRRKDREIQSRQEMEHIISNCEVCHLALSTPEGYPYALALNFGYATGEPPALYFHCATSGKKLDLIRRNPRCAFILDRPRGLVTGPTACDCAMNFESVMGSGVIEILDDPVQRRFGLDRIMAQYGQTASTYQPHELNKTLVLKLTIEEMTGKRRV